MNKKCILFLLIFTTIFSFSQIRVFSDEDDLSERYKKWLDEDVIYIIGPLEKEVFLKLITDRERDLFIKAFWKHRDPTPGTPKNEYKEEHNRRKKHANHFFGRATPKPGWQTDRGRIYIILGEPNDIQRFEGSDMIYPAEVWFYQDMTKFGLPAGFNLVFFQEGGTGEYKLYSPLKNGPQALITGYFGDKVDYFAAYEKLSELEPALAVVSLSLIPGEQTAALGRPSMYSDILIQRVETAPSRLIEEKYAQKFLEYKDIVEVEYSANYISCDSLVKIIRYPSGINFVHFAIEPERLSVDFFEEKYFTSLKINGTVSNMEGKIIHQFEREISLEFDEEQLEQISSMPFGIRDMFPIIPGNYKMSVIIKNEVSREFTSMERDIFIPGDDDTLQMTSLILGYQMNEDIPPNNRLRPFQIGKNQLSIQTNRVFLREDDLVVFFQIHGLSPEEKNYGEIKYTFFKDGKEFQAITKRINMYSALPSIIEQFTIQEFLPDHYRLQVSLSINSREVLSESEEFAITPLQAIPRAWEHRRLLPSIDDPIYSYLIGIQLFNIGKIKEAQIHLEEAYSEKPNSIGFALGLAEAYMILKDYNKVVSILQPFLNQPQAPDYQVYFIVGKAYQNLHDLRKAIDVLDKALSHYGLNTNILNAIGECYFQLGEIEGALTAWEKSIEINPAQPQITKKIEDIKEKK